MDRKNEKCVKMVCPLCKSVYDIQESLSHLTKADGVKCSKCFQEKFTFVNLVLTKFEQQKMYNI